MNNTDLRKHCYAMGYSDDEVGAFYDGYEKGKADAIDECIGIVKFYQNQYDGIYWAIRELEELKQNEND